VKALWRVLGVAGVLASVAAGCGGQSSGGGTDTNTNWLRHCDEDADCGALSCLCNVCTASCESDGECMGRGGEATCFAERASCAGGSRICVAPDTSPTAISATPVDEITGEPLGTTDKNDTPSQCGRPENDYFSLDPACSTLGVECLAPSVAFNDACGCGCTAAAEYPRRCRDQCSLGDECVQHTMQAFPTFVETERLWTRMCPLLGLAEGRCQDGKVFLFFSNGFTGEVRYYDAARERFFGLGTFTDVLDRTCGGQSYWPEPILCDMPTVVRSICGGFDLDEVFSDLPWADGRPGDLP
jgi:hypothetical protein